MTLALAVAVARDHGHLDDARGTRPSFHSREVSVAEFSCCPRKKGPPERVAQLVSSQMLISSSLLPVAGPPTRRGGGYTQSVERRPRGGLTHPLEVPC
jgi:hypothetical protein